MKKFLFTEHYSRFDVLMILIIAAFLNALMDAFVW